MQHEWKLTEMYIKFQPVNLKSVDHLVYLGIVGTKILK
jgi:hypothetical protein